MILDPTSFCNLGKTSLYTLSCLSMNPDFSNWAPEMGILFTIRWTVSSSQFSCLCCKWYSCNCLLDYSLKKCWSRLFRYCSSEVLSLEPFLGSFHRVWSTSFTINFIRHFWNETNYVFSKGVMNMNLPIWTWHIFTMMIHLLSIPLIISITPKYGGINIYTKIYNIRPHHTSFLIITIPFFLT